MKKGQEKWRRPQLHGTAAIMLASVCVAVADIGQETVLVCMLIDASWVCIKNML